MLAAQNNHPSVVRLLLSPTANLNFASALAVRRSSASASNAFPSPTISGTFGIKSSHGKNLWPLGSEIRDSSTLASGNLSSVMLVADGEVSKKATSVLRLHQPPASGDQTALDGGNPLAADLSWMQARLNACDVYGRTALHRAVANGHEECVDILIEVFIFFPYIIKYSVFHSYIFICISIFAYICPVV
ncbi:unnamed protein product [Protopolystoma xenopodis]|uniref:Uncharacterized protein n=1 Tax=Protopolystoma xenopodis TaxID=117903 RepID=A0A448WIJ2_9PLAT|nr:unnamed protein product [Protopolystoma xenopodis]